VTIKQTFGKTRRAALLLGAAVALAACASTDSAVRTADATAAPVAEATHASGVKIEALRLSAAGYMIDLRYRVVDREKALPIFERKARPMLIDAAGAQLAVPNTPKLGQLRSTGTRNVKEDRVYSMIFANPGRYVERGAKLTLVIGDARFDGLVVE
jgi:hypothetical protein